MAYALDLGGDLLLSKTSESVKTRTWSTRSVHHAEISRRGTESNGSKMTVFARHVPSAAAAWQPSHLAPLAGTETAVQCAFVLQRWNQTRTIRQAGAEPAGAGGWGTTCRTGAPPLRPTPSVLCKNRYVKTVLLTSYVLQTYDLTSVENRTKKTASRRSWDTSGVINDRLRRYLCPRCSCRHPLAQGDHPNLLRFRRYATSHTRLDPPPGLVTLSSGTGPGPSGSQQRQNRPTEETDKK